MDKKTVSRRDFVKLAGMAAGAAVLAACQPEVVEKKVVETQIVEKVATQIVEKKVVETQVQVKEVEKVVTATPLPTKPPEPVVMDVWFNTNIPDINKEWTSDPNNEEFKAQCHLFALAGQAPRCVDENHHP